MEKNKKNILFITPQLPYPPISGGTIKSFKMIDFLSRNYNLYLLTLLKTEDDIKNEKIFLDKFRHYLVVYKSFPLHHRIFSRNLINLIKSYIINKPFAVFRNSNNEMKNYVEELILSTNIDCIIIDHYISFQFIENLISVIKHKKIKVFLHEHNAEYLLWDRYARNEKNILKKFIAKLEAMRVKSYEKKICLLSDKILCVSCDDIRNLKKIGIPENKCILIMSVGDDELLHKPDISFEDTEEALLFIGTLSWEANIDGLIWFITSGWNLLKQKFPNLKFYIIGKNPPKKLLEPSHKFKDIFFTGYVEDLEPYYRKSRVFISPLRFGSGIKIKNINAMYRGIPLVTTSIGAEGINGINGVHFFVCDNITEFLIKIEILLVDKKIWYKLSRNSRELMRKEYTWERVLISLKKVIDECDES